MFKKVMRRTLSLTIVCALMANVTLLGYADESVNNENVSQEVITEVEVLNDNAPIFTVRAANDTASTNEDEVVSIDVLANDESINKEITFFDLESTQNGSITILPDGNLQYEPAKNFYGEDTFKYTIDNVSKATVTVTVTPVNDPPSGGTYMSFTYENVPFPIMGYQALWLDVDNTIEELYISDMETPSNGTIVELAEGSYVYTPNVGFTGTEEISYRITDAGGERGKGLFSIEVRAASGIAPVAKDYNLEINEDAETIINVLSDIEADGNRNKVIVDYDRTTSSSGSVTLNSDNNFVYTPLENYYGSDSFTYTLNRGSVGTVNINILSVNDEPITKDCHFVAFEATPTVLSLNEFNVSDVDDELFLLVISSTSDPENGSITINNDGTITYTPDVGFTNSETFEYTVSDPSGATSTSKMIVRIIEPPYVNAVGNSDQAVTNEDTAVDIDVTFNDKEDSNGEKNINGYDEVSEYGGLIEENENGTLKYTPKENFNGTDTFNYNYDGSTNIEVEVTIEAVNDKPTTNDISSIMVMNIYGEGDLNDRDPQTLNSKVIRPTSLDIEDGVLTNYTIDTEPQNGSVETGQVIKYTPDKNFIGTDTFTYSVTDSNSEVATGTVSIIVYEYKANDDTAQTYMNTPVIIDVLENDPAAYDNRGFLEYMERSVKGGTIVRNDDDTLTYTPKDGYLGEDSFTYVSESEMEANVTINVSERPDTPPVAVNDETSVAEDGEVNINVIENDQDDGKGEFLIESFDSLSTKGGSITKNLDGTLKFLPKENTNGTDYFKYRLNEGSEALVTINISSDNDLPVANDIYLQVKVGQSVTHTLTSNDVSDIEDDFDDIELDSLGTPSLGNSVVVNENTFKYTTTSQSNASDTFTYTVFDTDGARVSATVHINITGETVSSTPVYTPPSPKEDDDYVVIEDEENPLGFVKIHSPYVSGYPEGDFRPYNSITRAELAVVMARMLELDLETEVKSVYSDMTSEHWASKYVEASTKIGLFSGYENGDFRPSENMTKAEFAVVFDKYWNYMGIDVDQEVLNITDVDAHWAKTSIEKVLSANVMETSEEGLFNPDAKITRIQVVRIINKILSRDPNEREEATFWDVSQGNVSYADVEAAIGGIE